MNLKEYIELLAKFEDKSLPVCIADRSSEYIGAYEEDAHHIKVRTGDYANEDYEIAHGKFLCIGSYRE